MSRAAITRVMFAMLSLAVAGCGTMDFPSAAANAGFSIHASAQSVATNGEVALNAVLPSGEPAAVTWIIASGNNAPTLGEGHVDATGIYTAPGSLSADAVQVRIEAKLESNPAHPSLLLTEQGGYRLNLHMANAAAA